MRALAALLLATSCAPPAYAVPASSPWPAEDFARVADRIVQGWPLDLTGVHAIDVGRALGPPLEVVCVTSDVDYPARTVAGHTRVAGQYLASGPTGVPTIALACGYPSVRASAYPQEAIHRVLDATGGDPYVTEEGVEPGDEHDREVRAALTSLEQHVKHGGSP
jgi:hypothetical protein